MCNTCGCNVTDANRHLLDEHADDHQDPGPGATGAVGTVAVLKRLLDANDQEAAHNREHFDAHGVLAINLMSSPGSGKTRLLEATIDALGGELRIGVIEGDLETENDAARIRARGVPAHQITTGTACHLDAHMVHHALDHVPLAGLDLLFIENVGNLVCPASFDLGQHRNVTLLSVTEGDDKPAKYPVMFRAADLLLLTKADLLGVIDEFAPERATRAFRDLANPAPVLTISAKTGAGLEAWLAWLRWEVAAQKARAAAGETARPKVQPEGAALHGHDHAHTHAHEHEHTHADGTTHAHPHTHTHAHGHTHPHGGEHDHGHEHPDGHAPGDDHHHDHGA
jgi:hydrogenase nickel incorporation protein HypB